VIKPIGYWFDHLNSLPFFSIWVVWKSAKTPHEQFDLLKATDIYGKAFQARITSKLKVLTNFCETLHPIETSTTHLRQGFQN
jgi:hypothetical protein